MPGPLLSGGAAIAVAYGLRALGTGELRPLYSLLLVGGAATLAAVVVLLAIERDIRERVLAFARRRRGTPSEPDREPSVDPQLRPMLDVDPSSEPAEYPEIARIVPATGVSLEQSPNGTHPETAAVRANRPS